MKKNLLSSAFIFCSLFLNAQTQQGNVNEIAKGQKTQAVQDENKSGFQKENLRFGGNFGASFGSITSVDISPAVGYQFTRMFQAGLGLIYNYYADNRYTPNFSMNIYGINPYAEFMPLRMSSFALYLRGEMGFLNYNTNFNPNLEVNREWILYPLVGGGILLPVGRSGGISLSLLWNLNETDKSIYSSNPIIRMGFSFGL